MKLITSAKSFLPSNPNSAAVSMQQRGNMDMNGNRSATYGAPTQIPKPPTAPPRPTYGGGYVLIGLLGLMWNKTPSMHWDIFRLQLANNRYLIKNLPPPW